FLFNRWVAKLPDSISATVLALKNQKVDQRVIMSTADDVWERTRGYTVATVASTSRPLPGQQRQRDRSTAHNHSRSRSRTESSSNPSLCWYHRRHGNNATKCRAPCSKAKAPASAENNRQ